MRAIRSAVARVRAMLTGRDRSADLRREIASHIAEAAEEFERQGLSPADARRRALASFGGVTQTEEAYRDGLVVRWLDTASRDVRHATRALIRTPGFCLIVIAILAIGTGAVTSVFALVDRVVLQPLPYPNADRLVTIEHVAPGLKLTESGSSTGLYFYYGERAGSIESLGGYSRTLSTNLTLPNGDVERIQLTRVTASLFRTIGVAPAHGRLFTDEDGAPGFMDARWAIPTLLSHQFWTDRFGADPAVVGQMVKINDSPRLVVGVMPEGFEFPDSATQVWMLSEPPRTSANFARSFDLRVVARLRRGATVASAGTELTQLVSQVQGVFPDATPERIAEAAVQPIVRPLKSVMIGDIAGALWPLLGGMALLLTVACANVATLFTGRAEHGQRETAVRLALGASLGQIARSAFVEALALTLIAAAAGLGLARLALATTVALAPIALPRVGEIGLDGWSIGLALTLAVVIAALYSLLAVRGLNRDATGHTVRSGRQLTGSSARTSHRLLTAQVGLALMLMVLSALMLRTYLNLTARPLGFSPERLLTMEIGLPSRFAGQHARIFRALVDEVQRVPGVTDAGAASFAPLTPVQYNFPLHLSATPVAFKFFVPGYFQAMRTPIVEGAGIATADETTMAMPVLISAPLARRLFGRASAIGQPLHRLNQDGSPVELGARTARAPVPPFVVAGVVGEVRETSLRAEPAEMVYVPILEPNVERSIVPTGLTLVVRSAGDPLSLTDAVRNAVRTASPNLSIGRIQEMDAIVSAARAPETFVGGLLLAAALVAFALGLIGIQGNVAQFVRHRTQEIAIRLALGANRREVIRLAAAGAIRSVLVGSTIGLLAALLATPLVSSLLFGVAPRDPLALTLAASSLLTAAIGTAWLAGVRATTLPLLPALRGE
jgi:putative ABC transport system permease protein